MCIASIELLLIVVGCSQDLGSQGDGNMGGPSVESWRFCYFTSCQAVVREF